MSAAPFPHNEHERVAKLQSYGVLDSPPQKAFDAITALASSICGTPIALISLVDEDRQWFKSKVGLGAQETPREDAFCAHSILTPHQVMLVEDARLDPRFRDNPLVLNEPDIRFYAGAPIVSAEGFALGTVCVIDSQPRSITPEQQAGLQSLSRLVSSLLEHERLLHSETQRVSARAKRYREVANAMITTGRDLNTFIDLDYTYRHVNPAYLSYWNVGMDQIVDQPVRSVVGAELFDQTIQPALDRALAGEEVHFETAVHFNGSGLRHMEVSYLPARRESGEVFGVVVRAHDAQERKEREDHLRSTVALLEQKTLAQDRFIHIVSHDLREPINTINNFASLLAQDESLSLPAPAQRYLRFVAEGGLRMKCLLDDLTGLLQLDHQTIEKQPVDLVTIASQVRDDLTAALQGKNGKIEFGNLPMAHGDASLLRVALQNLVGNAVKFVAKGTSPMVKISAHVESDTLRIDVHDNGIGMETEHIAKTFEIFKRLHTGKAYPGSGLGLSICRRIAELHGGKLSATSEPGVGSCFTLVLPILPPGNEPQRIGDEHL